MQEFIKNGDQITNHLQNLISKEQQNQDNNDFDKQLFIGHMKLKNMYEHQLIHKLSKILEKDMKSQSDSLRL